MTTRTYSCNCGNFEAQVTGDPALACWCHCGMCRKHTGAAMQLGVFPEFKINKGDDQLIKWTGNNGAVYRFSCGKCGSFCYKLFEDGTIVVPLGTLEPYVKPTMHIMVAHRGEQPIMFPELPQHENGPPS